MALVDVMLTLMAFPQRWDGAGLDLRILVAPRGDPLGPLAPGAPPFAEARLSLDALLIPSLDRLPAPADVTARLPLNGAAANGAAALFRQLANSFPIDPNPPGGVPPLTTTQIRKYLPPSYRSAFAFERSQGDFAVTDRSYACALVNAVGPDRPPRPNPPANPTWGQVLARAMRQPLLAEALGLVYRARVVPPAADFFRDGGWLYIDLDPASPYAAQAAASADFLKLYAARIPPLAAGAAASRPLFASVLFPVGNAPGPGSYDEIFIDAETYDDGFARIVHTHQPDRHDDLDLTGAGTDGPKPSSDVGIKLGWDDEQLVTWMNRQLTEDPRTGSPTARDTPMGVRAYRVDVRELQTRGMPNPWTSLTAVRGRLRLGPIPLGVFDGEMGVEASPVQLQGRPDGDYWLPSYVTKWSGTTLVQPDPTRSILSGAGPAAQPTLQPVDDDKVPLRYGRGYEFRVRLTDLTGGGPTPDDAAFNRSPAGVATCRFRRFVPPKVASVGTPSTSADTRTVTYPIYRPLLGYPALVFTGFPNARQLLIDDVPNAQAQTREVGLPDPDVTLLRVDVAVGSLEFDPVNLSETGEPLRALYTAARPFPNAPADSLTLRFQYQDLPDIAALPGPGAAGPLPLPTGRDVRVTLTPIARPDPSMVAGTADPALDPDADPTALDTQDPRLLYFGSQGARVGLPSTISLRREPDDESGLLSDVPGHPFQVVLLQPDPAPGQFLVAAQAMTGQQGRAPTDLAQRLAQQLGLAIDGLTYTGPPGHRTVFGCSGAMRHLLAPDRSAITFASKSDLTGHWIAVVRMRLDRDWTWDALDDGGFEVRRNSGSGEEAVGTIVLPRSISALAVQPGLDVDRSATELIFFDAIDPKPAVGALPKELNVTYTVTARFRQAPATADWPWQRQVKLPMATPPTQVPRLASAGLALSPYQEEDNYSSTQPRRRMLWLEFAEPLQNQRDGYFARVLAQAADPLLTGVAPEPPPVPNEPPLSVDPELIRVITPGQSDDSAGLDAMQQLIAAEGSPRHFLVPLPSGIYEGAPELFGFFVYELRVGHAQGWSTAQGRFGSPLRVTGVQHPAPALTCQATRKPAGITASSPFAIPVADGQIRLNGRPPLSQLWVLLYAQVLQADGASWRNVLLGQTRAPFSEKAYLGQTGPLPYGVANWSQDTILRSLTALGLPADEPLSVLAVELLPEPTAVFDDPLGADLGQVRILRTSPLTPVPFVCVDA